MNKIYKWTTHIALSLFFCLILLIASTTLVSYSLKGKPLYLKQKKDKIQMNVQELITDYVDTYKIETRNNTTFLYTTTSLNKDEYIALLTNIYVNKPTNTYDIQVINTFTYDNSNMWASITGNGVSISANFIG